MRWWTILVIFSLVLIPTVSGQLTLYDSGPLVFPYILVGDGYTFEIFIRNPGSTVFNGNLSFRSGDAPVNLNINGVVRNKLPVIIQPGGVKVYRGSASTAINGYALLSYKAPGQTPIGEIVLQNFGRRLTGKAYPSSLSYSVLGSAKFAWESLVSVVNLSSTSQDVEVNLVSAQGVKLGTGSVIVPASGQSTSLIKDLFPAISGPVFTGSLIFTGIDPIAVGGVLRFRNGADEIMDAVPSPGDRNLWIDPTKLLVSYNPPYVKVSGHLHNYDIADLIFVEISIAGFSQSGEYVGGKTTYIKGINRKLDGSTFTNACLIPDSTGYFQTIFEVAEEPKFLEVQAAGEVAVTQAPKGRITVMDYSVSPWSSWANVSGNIKNTGTLPLKNAWLEIAVLNNMGQVLDTAFNLPTSQDLSVGQVTDFSEYLLVKKSLIASVVFLPEWNDVEPTALKIEPRTATDLSRDEYIRSLRASTIINEDLVKVRSNKLRTLMKH